jgi:hypothetical protein
MGFNSQPQRKFFGTRCVFAKVLSATVSVLRLHHEPRWILSLIRLESFKLFV